MAARSKCRNRKQLSGGTLRISIALTVALFSLAAWADTLDYARQTVVVTSLETGSIGLQVSQSLQRRALSLLGQASYDRSRTVAGFLAAHPQAARRLERIALESRHGATRFLSDGAVSTEHEFPINGAILNVILPPTGDGKLLGKTACPCCGQAWPEGKEPPPGVRPVPLESGSGPTWTGILIDATNLGIQPALFPSVVTEDDREVIGPGFASAEKLAQLGPVGWFRDRTQAFVSERVGTNPLVIRALRVTGTNSCDLVVSQYDAARIHGSKANLQLLSECRVGLLVDQP